MITMHSAFGQEQGRGGHAWRPGLGAALQPGKSGRREKQVPYAEQGYLGKKVLCGGRVWGWAGDSG